MKKTLMMITAVALASSAMAETYIEPGNIVGYTKVDLAVGYTLLGACFEGCGVGQSVKINDLVGDFYGAGEMSYADQLQVWYPGGYKFYYFGDDNWGEGYDKMWYEDGNDAEPTEDTINASDAMAAWYLRRSAAGNSTMMTIAGQVGTNNVKIWVGAGYTMLANPFPVTVKINDLIGDFYGAGEMGYADQLQVWYPGGYKFYYFGDDNWGEGYDKMWYEDGNDAEPTENTIEPGGAAWYLHRDSGCWLTIPAPVID